MDLMTALWALIDAGFSPDDIRTALDVIESELPDEE